MAEKAAVSQIRSEPIKITHTVFPRLKLAAKGWGCWLGFVVFLKTCYLLV